MRKKTAVMLKDHRGMSLIELMIGMFVFAVVITATLYIFVPLMDTMVRSNEVAEYNTLFDNVANLIISDISSLTLMPGGNLDLNDGPVSLNTNRLITYDKDSIQDSDTGMREGTIRRNGNPLLPERFAGERTDISFRLALDSDPDIEVVYLLTVSLTRRNPRTGEINENLTITRDYAVRPLVLNQYN